MSMRRSARERGPRRRIGTSKAPGTALESSTCSRILLLRMSAGGPYRLRPSKWSQSAVAGPSAQTPYTAMRTKLNPRRRAHEKPSAKAASSSYVRNGARGARVPTGPPSLIPVPLSSAEPASRFSIPFEPTGRASLPASTKTLLFSCFSGPFTGVRGDSNFNSHRNSSRPLRRNATKVGGPIRNRTGVQGFAPLRNHRHRALGALSRQLAESTSFPLSGRGRSCSNRTRLVPIGAHWPCSPLHASCCSPSIVDIRLACAGLTDKSAVTLRCIASVRQLCEETVEDDRA